MNKYKYIQVELKFAKSLTQGPVGHLFIRYHDTEINPLSLLERLQL